MPLYKIDKDRYDKLMRLEYKLKIINNELNRKIINNDDIDKFKSQVLDRLLIDKPIQKNIDTFDEIINCVEEMNEYKSEIFVIEKKRKPIKKKFEGFGKIIISIE